jgi:hypothetical protein
MRAKVWKL